jgi:hypothetical protein
VQQTATGLMIDPAQINSKAFFDVMKVVVTDMQAVG